MTETMTPEAIETAAKAAGISAFRLCQEAGVAHSVWSRWKGGKREPQLNTYRRLMAALKAAQARSDDAVPSPR